MQPSRSRVWKGSTRESLRKIFGSPQLTISPPSGPPWKASALKPRMHFINCHGGPADSHFYGQHGEDYPVSHETPDVAEKILEGTVAAEECCFGADLFNSFKLAQDMGICNRYLFVGRSGWLLRQYDDGVWAALGERPGGHHHAGFPQACLVGSFAGTRGSASSVGLRPEECGSRSDRPEDPFAVLSSG